MQTISAQLGIIVGLIISLILLSAYFIWSDRRHKREYSEELEKARRDAVKRSKSVIRASVSEEMVPLFEGFPYNTGDMKLFGKPVDYIVFDGMNELRDGNVDRQITIILADLKTGKAVKTQVQKAIKDAIDNGRIRFEEWRIDEHNKLKII